MFKKSRKRLIRYGLLTANFALLFGVVTFVVHSSSYGQSLVHANATAVANNNAASNPLDQVSSADIAVNLAHMAGLPETDSVTNYADSFNTQTTLADSSTQVVAKPQVIASTAKSRKDIITYTVQAGDSVSSLAIKYGITSDSVKNTNGLTSDSLSPNQKLTIPPQNGIVYTVKATDTIKSLAQKYSASEDSITNVNDAEVSGIKAGEQIIIPDAVMPVVHTVTYTAPAPSYTNFAFGGSSPIYGDNGYSYGWCTYGAALLRAQMGRPVPSNLGNASTWYILAQRAGLPTGSTPSDGAVAVNQAGNHVMVVEQVNDDGSFWVQEMNGGGQVSMTDTRPAGGWNRWDYRLIPSVGYLKFIY